MSKSSEPLTSIKPGINANSANNPFFAEQKKQVSDVKKEEISYPKLKAANNDNNNNVDDYDLGIKLPSDQSKYDNIFCKILKYYIAPVSIDFRYSLSCFIFHVANFFLTLGVFIFEVTAISTAVPFVILCCIGLVLIWITFEFVIIFAFIDLKMSYVLVERESEIKEERKHLIELSLYTRKMPLCFCWNDSEDSWINVMFQRIKYLYISIDLYIIIGYHIIIKPAITLVTHISGYFALYSLYLFIIPFWYGVNNNLFLENKLCMFGGSSCDNNGNNCTCYGWQIHDFGNAFAVGVVGLFTLPLTLRFCNWCAKVAKRGNYFFYTYYYTDDPTLVSDRKSLIANKKQPVMQPNRNIDIEDDDMHAL